MMCEASPARMRFSLSDLEGIGCWAAGEGSGLLKADREIRLFNRRARGVFLDLGGLGPRASCFGEDRRMGSLNGRSS